jgi:predicted nucleic acid-binding protein
MPGRYFLDTNIFVYSFDPEARTKSRRATELIREAVASRRGIVSYQVVQEFFNVAFRRFEEPMSHMEAEQYLGTVFRPLLAVHSSVALFQEALAINQRYRMNWFDSLIIAAAMAGECEVLYSEDLQDGQKFGGLQVQNPFA